MDVTLITGASSGIGEAIAYQFARKGHNLFLVARNEQKLSELCSKLTVQYRIQAHYVAADLSQPDAADLVFEESKKKGLSINVLINNAGVGSSGEFYKNDLRAELAMLQLNISSLVALTHLFLPTMIQHKKGSIINVASIAALFPCPYMAAYGASKAFVRSFTQAMTEECKPYGIDVMLFMPGLTTTNFMNTAANNNAWGKVLVEGVKTQTSGQVAKEMIDAWERQKKVYISGRQNRMMVKVASLIPDTLIAGSFARSKRKKMNLSI